MAGRTFAVTLNPKLFFGTILSKNWPEITTRENWGVHFDTGTSAQRNYKIFAYFDTGTTLWELLANMYLPILTQELQDSYWVLVSGENPVSVDL